MYNVILAAGDGKRFSKYDLPKPLLKAKNYPLILRSAFSLPKKKKFLFVCKKKHILKFSNLFTIIKKKISKAKFIYLSRTTKGQASSLLSIKKFVKKNVPLLVTSTDFFFKFNLKDFENYIKNDYEVIFAVKPSKFMKTNFKQFGWVRSDKYNNVTEISCKKKIKGNSSQDKVIIGAFGFTSFKSFYKGYNLMKKKRFLTNNEYYLDNLMNEISSFKKIKIIPVKKFINWGTPFEYEKNKYK